MPNCILETVRNWFPIAKTESEEYVGHHWGWKLTLDISSLEKTEIKINLFLLSFSNIFFSAIKNLYYERDELLSCVEWPLSRVTQLYMLIRSCLAAIFYWLSWGSPANLKIDSSKMKIWILIFKIFQKTKHVIRK